MRLDSYEREFTVRELNELLQELSFYLRYFFYVRVSISFFLPQAVLIIFYVLIIFNLFRNQKRLIMHRPNQKSDVTQKNILSLKSRLVF